MTGILIARSAGCIATIVLLLVAADVVFPTLVEVALFLVVCHLRFSHLMSLERSLRTQSALLPRIAVLAATASGSGASSGTIAALFGHCSRVSAAAFLSHFRLPPVLMCVDG
jgi:hypothetical protein